MLVSASENLALNKPAWKSSTYAHTYVPTADKAVDGNAADNFNGKSCTHTKEEQRPWWVVDLGAEYLVSDVVITNRGDCCGDVFEDFYSDYLPIRS